jgi:NAD(P)-dependent dehydrogenase (short-subunit alcohol dehydrogenase family)
MLTNYQKDGLQDDGPRVRSRHSLQLHCTSDRKHVHVRVQPSLSTKLKRNLTKSVRRLQKSIGDDEDSVAKLKRLEMMLPMQRITQPSDIANAAWYLGSDQSSFVTGTMLEVDGGRGV